MYISQNFYLKLTSKNNKKQEYIQFVFNWINLICLEQPSVVPILDHLNPGGQDTIFSTNGYLSSKRTSVLACIPSPVVSITERLGCVSMSTKFSYHQKLPNFFYWISKTLSNSHYLMNFYLVLHIRLEYTHVYLVILTCSKFMDFYLKVCCSSLCLLHSLFKLLSYHISSKE